MEAPETPKASPGHLQDAPKTSKMSLRSSKICIPRPEPLKTQNLKKTWFWPATQNWENLRQNLTILGTFGPILGKCAFWYQKLDFGQRPRINKIYVEI